ncbi:hypothetical protein H9Q16_06545 [Sulfitobacter sp. TSTF-M16]|uniref:Uncharacterized protein n=2 Tax=Sulfitobacter aestuariivivens TaxID=2766981 RepID=A0A927D215_9RHOB|nr:hypothetical protein [Sulfitobacter aestuariivivens]MBD3663574.1 hypothetical protein [Sulfitobacter aestuariivivens]
MDALPMSVQRVLILGLVVAVAIGIGWKAPSFTGRLMAAGVFAAPFIVLMPVANYFEEIFQGMIGKDNEHKGARGLLLYGSVSAVVGYVLAWIGGAARIRREAS